MDDISGENDHELTALADVAREYGHHLGRYRFAGVAVDTEQRTLVVYRVPDPAFDSELLTLLAGDIEVRLVDAPHAREDLLVARERIWALAGDLPITSITIPVDGTRVVVVADAPETETQELLDRLVPGLALATRGDVVAR
ncbi:MAG TPA: hypothetical protein VLV82_03815 [Candidatus Angelobacter sp.]|nr:hypothetical protein [Candidatus Angelobacter sp.]